MTIVILKFLNLCHIKINYFNKMINEDNFNEKILESNNLLKKLNNDIKTRIKDYSKNDGGIIIVS
jgi:hypothetical protein